MFTTVVDHISAGTLPSVDAYSDDDVLAAMRALSVVAGRVEVIRAELLVAAADREMWRREGARSLAAWLAQHCAISARDARRAVDTARIIHTTRDIAAALMVGEIATAHVETIASSISMAGG